MLIVLHYFLAQLYSSFYKSARDFSPLVADRNDARRKGIAKYKNISKSNNPSLTVNSASFYAVGMQKILQTNVA